MLAVATIFRVRSASMATTEEGFPAPSAVEFVGPFQHHDVVVNGWQVPFLAATPEPGGRIHLSLDHRFGIDVTVEEAERIVPFLADCMAVALGYTGHPDAEGREPKRRHPIVRMAALGLSGEPTA